MENEKRPYVVCHMVSSLDGRIDGDFFGLPGMAPAWRANREIRAKYGCTAVINGTTTAAQIWADGVLDPKTLRQTLPQSGEKWARFDYAADPYAARYAVAVDPEGRLRWSGNTVERNGAVSHVIEVLTETVPDAVLTRLRELGISYIFAGQEKLNLPLMLTKLGALFGIERAMLTGGGATNWAFLAAGCIDEISVIVAPLADGGRDTATLFDRSAFAPDFVPVSLSLLGAETLPGDALWLRYAVRP